MHIVIVTGISGSGKSVALAALEDLGFFCVDNLPAKLLPDLIAVQTDRGTARVAVAIDSRSGGDTAEVSAHIRNLSRMGQVQVVFLTSNSPTLIARFSETRRRHPLNQRDALRELGVDDTRERSLSECIELERELMAPLAELGVVVDTSDLRSAQLRDWLRDVVNAQARSLLLTFETFAFKRGVPLDADLVFDVRCLPNPYYEPKLRPLTGQDAPVALYLAQIPAVESMTQDIKAFLLKWLPEYERDGRSYLTVAIGCTGGQHRSVYIAEQLAGHFRADTQVLVRHRALAAAAHAKH
ncbi:MAG: RNase adapter RapZ [Burkholderiaceae bacterium]